MEDLGQRHTEIDIKYFCGFFDGEGCIIVTEKRIRLKVNHTYPPILQLIKDAYGGGIYGPSVGVGYKPIWGWQLGGVLPVTNLLLRMLPYLVEKKRQAELAIDWAGTLPGGEKRKSLTRLTQEAKRIEHYENRQQTKDPFD